MHVIVKEPDICAVWRQACCGIPVLWNCNVVEMVCLLLSVWVSLC